MNTMIVPHLHLKPPCEVKDGEADRPRRLKLELPTTMANMESTEFGGFGYNGEVVSESELPPLPSPRPDSQLETYKGGLPDPQFTPESLMAEDVGKLRQKAANFALKASRPSCKPAARENWLQVHPQPHPYPYPYPQPQTVTIITKP